MSGTFFGLVISTPFSPPPALLLILFLPRTVGRLVALHILVCHLVSPAWHHMGPLILSYSYSTSILFPLLLYSMAPTLFHFFIYFYRRDWIVSLSSTCPPPQPPPLIGSSSSCPIKCNLEAPSRAIRAASLPTSCNEAQHILESIAPLVSPNGTSLLSKKQCKWKWTYSLASCREKPFLHTACNSYYQTHTHRTANLLPFSCCRLMLQLALFLWQHVCLYVHVCVCVPRQHSCFYSRWEGNGVHTDTCIIGIHLAFLQMLIATCFCALKFSPQFFFCSPVPGCTCAAVQVHVPSQQCEGGEWEESGSRTKNPRPWRAAATEGSRRALVM